MAETFSFGPDLIFLTADYFSESDWDADLDWRPVLDMGMQSHAGPTLETRREDTPNGPLYSVIGS